MYGLLSDSDILKEIQAGNIICEPFIHENLSNSSLDVRLGKKIKVYKETNIYTSAELPLISFNIDINGKTKAVYQNVDTKTIDISDEGYILHPNQFILAETLEYVGSNCNYIIAEVADKSTMARAGLSVCFSAGYIDVGNSLNITLEIKNNNNLPVKLVYGQHIAQLKFSYLSSPASKMYNGKYLNSKTVHESR